MLSLLWVGLCGYLLYEYLADRNKIARLFMVLFVFLLFSKLLFIDLPSWGLNEHSLLYGEFDGKGDYSFLHATMRLFDFGVIIAFLFFGFRVLTGDAGAVAARMLFGIAALGLLFVFLTLETNSFLAHFVPGLRAGGVSILWTLFSLGCLLAGIWRGMRVLRYVALGLFAIVGWKVLFSDLARLDPIYRIVAFMILGVLVLCGSFIYLKYRSTFATESAPPEEKKP